MKFTHIRPPLFVLLALLTVASMALAACGAPAAEPAAPIATEAPATESPAPVATEAPATEAPMPEAGDILLSESFDNNDNKWGVFDEDGYSAQIQDGQMVMKFTKADYSAYSLPKGSNFSDVDISFDAVIQEGAQNNTSFGVMCRYTDNDNYYDIGVEGDGYYGLWKLVNGERETIIAWTESTAIKSGIGETNRIRVVCSGSDLELYANDSLVFATQDASFTEGKFALRAERYDDDAATVAVAFDNLEVRYAAPLLSESFDNNDNEWTTYDGEEGSTQIENGQFVITVKQAPMTFWAMPQNNAASDVDMSFDAIQTGTPNNVWFGATCRYKDMNNYYDFSISNGMYMLGKVVDGNYETLIEFKGSKAIKEAVGETNRIRVTCSDNNLGFYANGEELFMVQDTSLATGGFTLTAGRNDVDDKPVSVTFDNVVVK